VRCNDVRSLLGGYVLQALEPDESEAVRVHLAGCAACAREWKQIEPLPGLLDHSPDPEASQAEPPASLEEAVLDRFARERPPLRASGRDRRGDGERRGRGRGARMLRRLGRPVPAAAAAALAGAALALAVSSALDGSDEPQVKVYGAHLHGDPATPGGPEPYAYARLSSFDAGTRVDLEVSGVRPRPDVIYELWCIREDGTKVSAGTFRVDRAGRAAVRLTTAARLGDYHRLSVEQRAPGSRGHAVMAGDIAY
jgi:hypothetical protein